MAERNIDVALATAKENLKYAKEEFEKAIKTKDTMRIEREAVCKA